MTIITLYSHLTPKLQLCDSIFAVPKLIQFPFKTFSCLPSNCFLVLRPLSTPSLIFTRPILSNPTRLLKILISDTCVMTDTLYPHHPAPSFFSQSQKSNPTGMKSKIFNRILLIK